MNDRYERDAPGRDGEDAAGGTATETTANETMVNEATGPEATAPETTAEAAGVEAETETDILRQELARTQAELEASMRANAEAQERFLRARADLENVRRRAAADSERAREAGIDTAVLPVIRVFDDLGRAITAAFQAPDPTSIVPGVQAVRDTLERELENLGIHPLGAVGDPFDPTVHEAVSIVAVPAGAEPGAIAEVFSVGFRRGDRLIRPARVVVYSDHA